MGLKRASIAVGLAAAVILAVVGISRARSVHANTSLQGISAVGEPAMNANALLPDYAERHPVTRLEKGDVAANENLSGQPLPPQPEAQLENEPAPRHVEYVHGHRRVVKERSFKHSAEIVGGSAAAGAAIGALAGGGKGAGIGALAGGASGFVYDRATHKKVQE